MLIALEADFVHKKSARPTARACRGAVLWWLALVVPVLACLGYLAAGALLAAPAGPAHQADLVAVLGGDNGPRYAVGRQLVLDGHSTRLLLIHPSAAAQQDASVHLAGVDLFEDFAPRDTWSEAQALRTWMQTNGWRSVLVVSDPPHMLRMQYTWWSVFRGSGLSFTLVATTPPWWQPWRWWQNPQARGFVTSEVMKLGYYLLLRW